MKARLDRRPSIDRIRGVLAYDRDTGILTWRITSGRAIAGREAGCFDKSSGYVRVRIDGYFILAHHVVWAIETGEWPEQLDHIDGNKAHYRFENLRQANQRQNLGNIGAPRHNTSGIKGVSWHKATAKWRAMISAAGKRVWLGVFDTKEEAGAAYLAAAKQHFGEEFARAENFQPSIMRPHAPLRGTHRPTVEEVRSALSYDCGTGVLRWKQALSFRGPIGAVAGRINLDGYVRIGLFGKQYPAHVLAWVIETGEWPSLVIHHEDAVRSNNRWPNLSEISQSENVCAGYARAAAGLPSLYSRKKAA